jgi:plastocyanin
MHRIKWSAVAVFCIAMPTCSASEVHGTITIQKGSAKVLGPSVYDLRGMAAFTAAPPAKETNLFERVAVWLEGGAVPAVPPANATIQQHNQRLEPSLVIIPVGSTVEFPNQDPVFHNIFSLSRTQAFDLGYYAEGHSRTVKFVRPGIVQVYCHVHPNMYAAVIVTSSPWFGKPSAEGEFSWPDVPLGKYRLCVWQKSMGVVHKDVVVGSAGSVRVNVAIPEESLDN